MQIREATQSDIPEITAIYNEVVLTSTATYNDLAVSEEDRTTWWRARLAQGYPVLVAVAVATESSESKSSLSETRISETTSSETVLGFASFGDFRPWPGYRFTVEGTIHIHAEARSQGVGTALLRQLVLRAQALGKHIMIAGVDADNPASIRFLTRFGFQPAGHLREVGFKFNRFLDLVFLQYWLSPATH